MADEYGVYTTKQGDTWDIIALDLYDDEFKASLLMQNNPQYIANVIFPAGINIRYPIVEDDTSSTLPPWKR